MSKPPLIKSKEDVKAKLLMVEQLADIEIATKLLKSDDKESEHSNQHPIDIHYHSLKCEMKIIEHDSEEMIVIKKYVKQTHAKTHKK